MDIPSDESDAGSARSRRWEPFILAHHPACKRFEHHIMRVGGTGLCIGCFVTYPTAGVTLAVLITVNLFNPLTLLHLFASGILLFLVSVTRKLFLKNLKSLLGHIAFRIVLGTSLGCMIMTFFVASEPLVKAGLALLIVVTAMIYQLHSVLRTLKTCRACGEHHRFPLCAGFPKK